MKTLILTLGLLPLLSFAAEKKRHPTPTDGQRAHIIQMDEDFPIDELAGEGVDLHPLSEVGKDEEMLPVDVQERFFRQAGLDAYVKGWDALDRDRLAMRTEHQSPEEAAGRYEGKIPLPQFVKLKNLINKYRAEQKQ